MEGAPERSQREIPTKITTAGRAEQNLEKRGHFKKGNLTRNRGARIGEGGLVVKESTSLRNSLHGFPPIRLD